ncbi:F-box protein At3g12350-like [Papaver somniferum]|uniref:F-box protein At3g12350-like n=1 Tax=Papaver somniferum TaxID=3469 RepID=UPI000E7002BC|nr:F-box protein At3g12350-like [Papaver somniferum]
MTSSSAAASSSSFTDFPEDVQLCILSFLEPPEITSFSCTSKRFSSLCQSDNKLWFSMCERKWGTNTQIKKWGNGQIHFKLLYRTLNRFEKLIGFWRRSGQQGNNTSITAGNGLIVPPPLVFFEWGESFITGSRVSPCKSGTYKVIKTPFLWLGISKRGEPLNFLDPECRFESPDDFVKIAEMGASSSTSDADLISVNVSFMGSNHVIVEENLFGYSYSSPEGKKLLGFRRSPSSNDDLGVVIEDVTGWESTSPGSLPEHQTSEIYQYFANRTSPGGDRASRRQRRKDKERNGRRKWDSQHFVKIVNCAPTSGRPLQGLWKGICDDMSLEFYLVAYDDIGGVTCRKVGDSVEPFSGYSPVFWTSNTTFIESPLSCEEEYLYDSRIHLQPPIVNHICDHSPFIENEEVLRILNINSSYDLVIPDLAVSSVNPRQAEGRIWQYASGTFGFGFLRNNYIIDMKHIVLDGHLLDTAECCN